jgi:hypothetical protein
MPVILTLLAAFVANQPSERNAVVFEPNASQVEAYGIFEVTVRLAEPLREEWNPFRDIRLEGEFQLDGGEPVKVEGFCDSSDGSISRIRFMPMRPGRVNYTLHLHAGDLHANSSGSFTVNPSQRRGALRNDPEHPFHFIWSNTGEHFFWNSTTTYWLLGWQDESIIQQAIDRLADKRINRIRVALNGRTADGMRWDEPMVVNTDQFKFHLNPWPAARPDNVVDPGLDTSRFDVAFWQKVERMLAQARQRDVVVSIIFYLDGADPGVDPFGKERMGCEEELAYYRYGVARLAAFSNVMWDVSNEYHLFRNEPWVEAMGKLINEHDPYGHLISVHGHGEFPFRTADWVNFAMYQSWDENGGHAFMLQQRAKQAATGRAMPQVNEEYGYEDHYPTRWGGGVKYPGRSADNRRRLAWGIYMAGGYQTTGERADRGTGKNIDSGGGWINGRGDSTMQMLDGYAHIVDCFTGLKWWELDPHDELVDDGCYCLAKPGECYLVYIPRGLTTTVHLAEGQYRAMAFNPRTGRRTPLQHPVSGLWRTRLPGASPSDLEDDWALIIERQAAGSSQ